MSDFFQVRKLKSHIVLLTLNRPDNYNALNLEFIGELDAALDELENQDIRTVILTGTEKSFCSGADLKQIRNFDQQDAKEFSMAGHQLFNKIENFPAPVLAAINGYALGGGCELACACDLRYAAASAKFGQPEAKVGMVTGWGGTFRLSRYIGVAKAKELIFTGKMIDAEKACKLGLVNKVFEDDSLLDKVSEIAYQIAENAPLAVQLSKKMLNRYCIDKNTMINEEALALSYCVNTADQTEAIEAFLEKRKPEFHNR
jgi:enoyl-CoA hydratase